jgi:hypothetical protein
MDNIQDLTLQLLLNQKDYNKIVKQKRNDSQEDNCFDNVKENEDKIIQCVKHLIDGNVGELNNSIISSFDAFTHELFKHWEMLRVKQDNKFNACDDSDDDQCPEPYTVAKNDSDDENEHDNDHNDNINVIDSSSVWRY